jgi:hypothetical protein
MNVNSLRFFSPPLNACLFVCRGRTTARPSFLRQQHHKVRSHCVTCFGACICVPFLCVAGWCVGGGRFSLMAQRKKKSKINPVASYVTFLSAFSTLYCRKMPCSICNGSSHNAATCPNKKMARPTDRVDPKTRFINNVKAQATQAKANLAGLFSPYARFQTFF